MYEFQGDDEIIVITEDCGKLEKGYAKTRINSTRKDRKL